MEKVTKIVVLAKQVPDTRNVGKDAMTPEGTVNRAALAAIFNPEDLNALEMALQMKDRIEGATVHVLTMGPQRAADIIREAMFRGADGGYLLSGREFAGSDTLATSYALSCALRKIEPDIIVAGRQAIDGDTAQVGPQVAEKLGLPQITYAEQLVSIDAGQIVVKRRLERGTEVVSSPLPAVNHRQLVGRRVPPPQCQARDEVQVCAGRLGAGRSRRGYTRIRRGARILADRRVRRSRCRSRSRTAGSVGFAHQGQEDPRTSCSRPRRPSAIRLPMPISNR